MLERGGEFEYLFEGKIIINKKVKKPIDNITPPLGEREEQAMVENKTIELTENQFYELYDKIVSSQELLLVRQYKSSLELLDSAKALMNTIIESNEQVYSVEETATYLGVSSKTILRMISKKIFNPVIKGRKYFIKENEIMKFKKTKIKKKNAKVTTLEVLGLIEER